MRRNDESIARQVLPWTLGTEGNGTGWLGHTARRNVESIARQVLPWILGIARPQRNRMMQEQLEEKSGERRYI